PAFPDNPLTFTALSFRPSPRRRGGYTMTRRALLATLLLTLCAVTSVAAAPEGQLTWAVHVSLAPAWFDPAETAGLITPFMILYGTPATGAGWIVPKKYVEKVGDDGFKRAPVGAGPYRFVSFNPGVELVLEAFEGYWRKTPSVKRLVFKSVTEEETRLVMLKRGEADIAYSIRGALAEELQRTPGLILKPNYPPGTFWLVFPEQWTDAKSPWA